MRGLQPQCEQIVLGEAYMNMLHLALDKPL